MLETQSSSRVGPGLSHEDSWEKVEGSQCGLQQILYHLSGGGDCLGSGDILFMCVTTCSVTCLGFVPLGQVPEGPRGLSVQGESVWSGQADRLGELAPSVFLFGFWALGLACFCFAGFVFEVPCFALHL